MDIHKLSRVMNGTFKHHEISAIINPSLRDIYKYLDKLDGEKRPISVDIETCGSEVACFGVANSPNEAMCINLRDDTENRFTEHEEALLLRRLNSSFNKNEIICHNGIFDSYYTWLKCYLRFTCTFDTMLAHHLLVPQLPHTLAFLVAQYTTHPFYKDEGKNWKEGGDINVWWTYNCKDAALTWACYKALKRDLEKHKLLTFFTEHVMRLQPHLVQATVHGLGSDLALRSRLQEQISEDVAAKKEEFNRLVAEATGSRDYLVISRWLPSRGPHCGMVL
jgi:DNA polymerase I-like protein with 3'-5' exonuclease and polymerase domains